MCDKYSSRRPFIQMRAQSASIFEQLGKTLSCPNTVVILGILDPIRTYTMSTRKKATIGINFSVLRQE